MFSTSCATGILRFAASKSVAPSSRCGTNQRILILPPTTLSIQSRQFHATHKQDILPLIGVGVVLFVGRYSWKALQRMDAEWDDYQWQLAQYEKQHGVVDASNTATTRYPGGTLAVDVGTMHMVFAYKKLQETKAEIVVTRQGARYTFCGISSNNNNEMTTYWSDKEPWNSTLNCHHSCNMNPVIIYPVTFNCPFGSIKPIRMRQRPWCRPSFSRHWSMSSIKPIPNSIKCDPSFAHHQIWTNLQLQLFLTRVWETTCYIIITNVYTGTSGCHLGCSATTIASRFTRNAYTGGGCRRTRDEYFSGTTQCRDSILAVAQIWR